MGNDIIDRQSGKSLRGKQASAPARAISLPVNRDRVVDYINAARIIPRSFCRFMPQTYATGNGLGSFDGTIV